jgi:hypothetical protein
MGTATEIVKPVLSCFHQLNICGLFLSCVTLQGLGGVKCSLEDPVTTLVFAF